MTRIVLFDLDGTLLDTERDFTAILNNQLAAYGLPPVPARLVRNTVSSGARALIRLGFGIDESHERFPGYLEELLASYESRIGATECVLFPGIGNLLRALDRQGTRWGIVTNKPGRFTDPLVRHFPAFASSAVVITPDLLKNSKPAPEGILMACERLQVAPENAIYVGDHPKDVQAARAAGAMSVGVRWGYIPVEHPIETWQADLVINHPDEILDHT